MKFKALIFDINGTVTDICTDESRDEIYRFTATLLSYQGVQIAAEELKDLFWLINKRQRRESAEEFPEFDVLGIFDEIIAKYATDYTFTLPAGKRKYLSIFISEAFRAATRLQLQLYPGVIEVMNQLKTNYRLAALSDGQSVWAHPELAAVGLDTYFNPIIISSDLGYRKPDVRMFELMLKKLSLNSDEVLFIGNDMYRDVFGAKQLGIESVFFKSNQGDQRNRGAEPDYIIYNFWELPKAVRFLEDKLNKIYQ
ncbi:MAG: HAD family hydrolase [Lentisphaeria bacterium]|nr:HAD family hydrolase [Lentisphaeria bacterium]